MIGGKVNLMDTKVSKFIKQVLCEFEEYFPLHTILKLKTIYIYQTPVSYTHLDVYKRQVYTFYDIFPAY